MPVTVTIDAAMFAGLERRAKTMGDRPSDYVRKLVEAAYLARVGAEKKLPAGDHELDQAVRAVFCLAGEFNVATISRVTGFPEDMVDNALRGLKKVGAEPRRPRLLALPAPERAATPADRTVRASGNAEVRSRFSPEQKALIAEMWKQGETAGVIGERVDADADQIRQFARDHRDLCPPRPGFSDAVNERRAARANAEYPVETIRAMWAAGSTLDEIGAAVGKTKGAVSVWVSKNRDVCPHRRQRGGVHG